MVLLNWSCSLVPGLLKDQGWGNLLMEVTSEGRGKSELSASGRIQPARPEPLNCPPSPRFCWLTRFLDLILLNFLNHLLILPLLLSRWTCLLLKRQNKSHQLKCTPKCHHTHHSTHIKPHLLVFPSVSGKRRALPSKFIHPVVCVCGGGGVLSLCLLWDPENLHSLLHFRHLSSLWAVFWFVLKCFISEPDYLAWWL